MTDPTVVDRARAWIAGDPDPRTRAELQALVDASDQAELAVRMAGSLEFGTAGLRGVLGAGSARMNRAVVIRSTRGLAEHLLSHQPDARTLPVVVGYDARHQSREFAECAAGVLVAAGIPVRYFDAPTPTPLCAYAARQLSATAAIVITASHNPAEWGGYKLYDASAAQMAPPEDAQVAMRIAGVGPAAGVPCTSGALDGASPRAQPLPDTLVERYLAELDALRPAAPADRAVRIAYTPLHGVGWQYAERALRRAGYVDLHVVDEQARPDPDFPTAPFPNPEEPGTLDRVTALAREVKADLLLAHDPDADRLAVSIPTVTRRFVRLSGNQVGLLLADYLLGQAGSVPQPLVISTVVSSPMLEAIAEARGARCERTLTGFKWILAAARGLEQAARLRFVFGYEEALGYTTGALVRDKDGISAAVLFADLVASCRARGVTVQERLWELYRQHGLWVSAARAVWATGSDGAARIEASFDRLATDPPSELGGHAVTRVTDYRAGAEQRPAWRSAAPLLHLTLDGGGQVCVRPSGTEPKLKVYVDLRFPVEDGELVSDAEERARAECEVLADEVVTRVGLEPKKD